MHGRAERLHVRRGQAGAREELIPCHSSQHTHTNRGSMHAAANSTLSMDTNACQSRPAYRTHQPHTIHEKAHR